MLGKGGQGSIFEAEKNNKLFALKKMMNPTNNRNLTQLEQRKEYEYFLKEIENISHCNHLNIVKFEEAFRDIGGNLYIVMELCENTLFQKRVKELGDDKYYDESFIIKIMKQICEGLSYLHGKKVAHRDIDP